MNKYELVVVVDAASSQEEKDTVLKEVIDVINKCEGKLINRNVWLDKHKFSFPIKKKNDGTYYILNLEGPQPGMAELRKLLRLNDKVLRFLLTRI